MLLGGNMNPVKTLIHKNSRGAALIVSIIFVLVFSALAVGIAAISGTNVQIASNHHKINSALSSAYSGLEFLRCYFSAITIPGTVSSTDRLQAVTASFQTELAHAGASNIAVNYNSTNQTLTIPPITLDSQHSRTFSAVITQVAPDTLQADITGTCGNTSRQIRVNFNFAQTGNNVFDFGVATKGALIMDGQAEFEAVNMAIEASVYIEADGVVNDALAMTGLASIAGDVFIADPYSTYTIGDHASVNGAFGEDADEHILVGSDYVDFPTPNPGYFRPFATGIEISGSSDWSTSSVLNNAVIKAGTNPTFSGDVTINGVLFIETPNVVKFSGKSTINGLIVGDGSIDEESGGNSILFAGQVQGNNVSTLEGAEFEAIKSETGTFIMAPGFNLNFAGQTSYDNGVIAANGLTFSGMAGGTINGTIINYSQEQAMTLSGQNTLLFNRSGATTNPAGFVPNQAIEFVPSSYSEPMI
jgi:Tfp pilus assembly protein PilX